MTQVVVNSQTYSDDGTAARDMLNGQHALWFFPMVSDSLVDLAAKVTAAQTAETNAELAETNAETAETNAETAATNAATSASQAANYAAALVATSATSLPIAVASKTFTTQASKQFTAGQYVIAASAANVANYMFGQVTSYSGTTLIVDVQAIGGSGTYADWNISVAGARGATGATGTGITPQAVGWIGTGGTAPKTLTVDVDFTMSDAASTSTAQTLSIKTLTSPRYTRDDDGTISGGTWAIDYANGPVIKATAGANITSITMANWPASGTEGHLSLRCVNFGAYTITFPAWNWRKSDLTTTTTFSDLSLTLPSSGVAFIDLRSDDGGTTIYATVR
jgi:hypothetical protein